MEAFFLGSSPKLLSESPCCEVTSIFLPTLALLRFLATLISPPLVSSLSTTFSFSVVFDFSFDSEYHHIVDTTRAPYMLRHCTTSDEAEEKVQRRQQGRGDLGRVFFVRVRCSTAGNEKIDAEVFTKRKVESSLHHASRKKV
jgi:hypothetical protein